MEGKTQMKLSEKWARTAAVPAKGVKQRGCDLMKSWENWRISVCLFLLVYKQAVDISLRKSNISL